MRSVTALALVVVALISTMLAFAQSDPAEPWAEVLAKFVNNRGEVDFRGLARERARLDAFLEYVARVSPRSAPESFSSREAKLAYYINAYNALAMFNVIDQSFPKSLSGLTKVSFFGLKHFTIGGERMSLYAFENDVIRPLGDERVHFALNCMSVSCPRLPRQPFRADRLNQQLEEEARKFFSDPRNLQTDPLRKVVRVSGILKFYTEDFLARIPTLVGYINQYVNPKIPSDYGVEFIDYNWTVNDQQRNLD